LRTRTAGQRVSSSGRVSNAPGAGRPLPPSPCQWPALDQIRQALRKANTRPPDVRGGIVPGAVGALAKPLGQMPLWRPWRAAVSSARSSSRPFRKGTKVHPNSWNSGAPVRNRERPRGRGRPAPGAFETRPEELTLCPAVRVLKGSVAVGPGCSRPSQRPGHHRKSQLGHS
jgi:hypothetical protein